jgi:hypothetical protein
MPQYTVQVDDSVAATIREDAQRRKISEEEAAAQILTAHHEEYRRFPDGVLRSGREKVVTLLSQIPCLKNFRSSGVDFRYWWVSFEVDMASPIAWPVIRALGLFLNTMSTEFMLPTVFKPTPDEWPKRPMRWHIESTEPRLDPADVASWLSLKLPQPLSEESSWLRED